MTYVYILQSVKNDKYYIGLTNNLKRRIQEHNNGKTKYTNIFKPYTIVFQQKYQTTKEARNIESKVKKLKSRKILDRIIQEKTIKLGS